MNFTRTSLALATSVTLALGCAALDANASANGATAAKQATDTSASPRSAGRTLTDATISSRLKLALAADELVKARKIDVDTVRGVVTMNGTVKNAAEKAQALKLAKQVEGVVEVKNNLKTSG